jgi:Raf kinase inhibitor-like YbhB/YbcL family protein
MALNLTSAAFAPNKPIPKQYTGEGADISPPLSWSGVPQGTKELALISDDPDAPTPKPWVHWVVYTIPPDSNGFRGQSLCPPIEAAINKLWSQLS